MDQTIFGREGNFIGKTEEVGWLQGRFTGKPRKTKSWGVSICPESQKVGINIKGGLWERSILYQNCVDGIFYSGAGEIEEVRRCVL